MRTFFSKEICVESVFQCYATWASGILLEMIIYDSSDTFVQAAERHASSVKMGM
jgi:hypothetical protein